MAKTSSSTSAIWFLNKKYDKKVIDTTCLCPVRKIFVIRKLLSSQECDNIASWMDDKGDDKHLYEKLEWGNRGR